MRPVAGGQYHVIREAYGRAPGFLFVFCNLTAVQGGAVAIIALICAQNLGVALYGVDPAGDWVAVVATLAVWLLVTLNLVGVRSGARVQSTTVVLKLLTLFGLVAVALAVEPRAAAEVAPAVPVLPGFAGLFAGVTITLFSYGGGQQALWVSGEVISARRTVPRAILVGVVVVTAAYLAANWAYLHLLGFAGTRDATALAAEAFSAAWPGVGRRVAAAAVAASALGVLNAQFLTGPRLTFAMARDGQFFPAFGRLHARFATPAPAILLLGGIATALMLGLGLDRTDLLTTGVVVVDATFFALTGLALPLLRRRSAAGERGPAWVAGAAIAFSVLQLLAITGSVLARDVRMIALTGLAWIAVAALTWAIWFRRPAST
jgi:APA family basic amino acid/polyamine antiporter